MSSKGKCCLSQGSDDAGWRDGFGGAILWSKLCGVHVNTDGSTSTSSYVYLHDINNIIVLHHTKCHKQVIRLQGA